MKPEEIKDIVAEMKRRHYDVWISEFRSYADRIEEAHGREIAEASTRAATAAVRLTNEKWMSETGNMAKLRRVCEQMLELLKAPPGFNGGGMSVELDEEQVVMWRDRFLDALAAPARQCDRYTGDDLDRDVDDAYASANKDLMVDYDREDLPIRWLLSTDAQVEAYKKKFKEELELLGKAWRGEK